MRCHSGRLCYGEPNAISNAIDYAKFYSHSHNAVIRVYDEAGNVIQTHEHAGEFKEAQIFGNTDPAIKVRAIKRIRGQPGGRFRIYNEMRKFSVRLVNGPQRIWRGRTVAYLHLQKCL